jgi:cobalt-zinc-cadmium efflux system protein
VPDSSQPPPSTEPDHGHAHGHTHSHGHGHAHGPTRDGDERRLLITLALAGLYMGVEAVGGWWYGSLALLADAGHMLSDSASLIVTVIALRLARLPPNPRRTWGYQRAEVLAAVTNGAALLAIGGGVLVEALRRIGQPAVVEGGPMIAIATGGLLVNVAALAILHGADRSSLNMRGAWLHVLSDLLGSAGAIVAGVLVLWKGWNWADTVASAAIAVLVLRSAWMLLKDCVSVLMESTPAHIDGDQLRERLLALPGVISAHDLHVWTITSGTLSMSGHLVVGESAEPRAVLQAAITRLREEFGLEHCTIQVEPEGFVEGKIHP